MLNQPSHACTQSAETLISGQSPLLTRMDDEDALTTGILPTTQVATPQGWKTASSLSTGDTVISADGSHQVICEVELRSVASQRSFGSLGVCPIFIPGYALGNLSSFAALPSQVFSVPPSVMGVQDRLVGGQATLRDLIGRNGIRELDHGEMPVAVALIFDVETTISCAHGSFAVCQGLPTRGKELSRCA